MQACIAIDWLTLHVKVPRRDFENVKSVYTIEKDKRQTRHFKGIYTIKKKDGEEIATMACDPHSEILSFDSGLLKIHNKFLYQRDFLKFVSGFLKELKCEFRSISRIDIALDFLTFAHGLRPENFIERYMRKGGYSKTGKSKGRVSFTETSKGKVFETLKFGSETSDVTYYLYNKSKELNDVKMKPWICDNWKANGWDGKQDVWRLEFSLKPSTKAIVDPENGELIFNFKTLDVIENIQEIFNYNFKKYFSFVQGKAKCRKDRMKPVKLFPERMKCAHVKIDLSDKIEAKRADKIFAKKLMELNQELRGHDFELAIYNNELLSYFLLHRNLAGWAEKKLQGVTITDRQAGKNAAEMFTMISQPGQERIRLLSVYRYNKLPENYSPLSKKYIST